MTLHDLPRHVTEPLAPAARAVPQQRPDRRYRLPDLPYPVNALEPHLDAETLWLHHDVHHAAHVDGANRALAALEIARDAADWSNVNQLETDLAFHVSGHVLHSVFWQNLTPRGGGRPTGALAEAISEHFGSFDAMREQFTRAAVAVQGSGWVVLAWEPTTQRLVVEQLHDHQSGSCTAATLLLVCDVWEHAYYLTHRHRRAAWLEAFWWLVDWGDVSRRFARCRPAVPSLDAFVWPAFVRDIVEPQPNSATTGAGLRRSCR